MPCLDLTAGIESAFALLLPDTGDDRPSTWQIKGSWKRWQLWKTGWGERVWMR